MKFIVNVAFRDQMIARLYTLNERFDRYYYSPAKVKNPRWVFLQNQRHEAISANPDSGLIFFYNLNGVIEHEEHDPGLADRIVATALTRFAKPTDARVFHDFDEGTQNPAWLGQAGQREPHKLPDGSSR